MLPDSRSFRGIGFPLNVFGQFRTTPPYTHSENFFRIRRRSMRTRSLSRSSITRRRSFMYRRTRIRTSRERRSGCARTARTRRHRPWPRAATVYVDFATTIVLLVRHIKLLSRQHYCSGYLPQSLERFGDFSLTATLYMRNPGPGTSSSLSRSWPYQESRKGRSATPQLLKSRTSTISFFESYLIDGYDCVAFKALRETAACLGGRGHRHVEERPRGRWSTRFARFTAAWAVCASAHTGELLRRMHDGGQ